MDAGDVIDLDITGVAHGGVFVGRHEGRVVFVADTMPGERVRVRLTDVGKASFWRGDTLDVLDASPHRRPHVWRQADLDTPPADRPGGADFGHISLDEQRRLKGIVLDDALVRIGGFAEASTPVHAADPLPDALPEDGTGWRTRVSLHVDDEGRVGPFAARSHRVIPVDDLPLATPEIARTAREIRGGAAGRIDLVEPADGRVRVIPRPQQPRASRSRRQGGTRRSDPGRRDDRAREVVLERVGGRGFRVDAGGFWQVHRAAASTLSRAVTRAVSTIQPDGVDPEARHLDLYGGVGLFAAALGEVGGPTTRVTSVESDPRATEHAGENLADWVGARVETGRVDRWLAATSAQAPTRERERLARGVVLLDPPRAGAGREVVTSIASLSPAAVVYVACDPVALARDLAIFRDAGYRTVGIEAFDLFPHSHHVEAVAALVRDGETKLTP